MNNKLLILVKNSLFNIFNINKFLDKKNRIKTFKTLMLGFIILLIILVYVCLYSYLGMDYLKEYNLQHYIPIIFFVFTSTFIFMTTIYKSKNALFDVKDNDMLFSIPIKFKHILASRVLSLYIINLVYAIIIFMPSFILYGIISKQSILFYLIGVLMTLFLPIIPIIIASAFGFLIAIVSSKGKSHKFVELFFTFVVFFAVFFSFSFIRQIGNLFIQNIQNIENFLKKYLYIIYLIKDIISNVNIISFIIFIVINIIVVYLFLLVLSKQYKKILSKLKDEKKLNSKKEKKYVRNGIINSMLKKEVKRYISSTIYVFNTAFGPILYVLLTIYVLIFGNNAINQVLNQGGLGDNSIFKIIILLTSFIICMTNTACSSISLEGKNFWIVKSLPIKEMDVFKSKILLNIIVAFPITFICTILLYVKLKLNILECILNLVLIMVLALCIAQFGILINLKYPRFDYITETQVVKQSFSSFISTFVPMIIILIGGSIFMYFSTNITRYVVVGVIVIVTILNIVEYLLLKTWGVKRFNNL